MSIEKQEKSEIYKFGDCVVDADRREITTSADAVTMQPKAFELLLYLIRNRHRAVDKDELQDALWPRSIVTETALTRCVMKARRAVGDDADKQAIIKTVHGHGYRFTAEVRDEAEQLDVIANAAESPVRRYTNWQPLVIAASAIALIAVVIVAWMYLSPPALSGPVRLAVLPIENATGDEELDWISTGLVALMNRMLEDGGIDTVSSRTVTNLAGDTPLAELVATGSEFREKLAQTSAATHVMSARLESNNGLYRLTYTLAGTDRRPTRRTMVGAEPTTLVKDVVGTVTSQIVDDPPPNNDQSTVSKDAFLNEAYARAMALYHEGRYEDAKALFEVIIEQEPHLFWPRYERALAMRNLRDFDGAERVLIELRDETSIAGREKDRASAENALGIMYMGKRRNEEARSAFNTTIELSMQIDDHLRTATGYQNLALLEKNLGNVELALQNMKKSEQIYQDMDIAMLPGTLLNNMSGILIQMGQFEAAERHSVRAIETFRYTGERLYESYALNRLSDIYTRMRVYDDALEMAERALSVRRELGDQHGIGSSLINIADISAQRGDITRSMQYAKQAYDIGAEIESDSITVAALVRIARAELRLGNPHDAADRWATIESIAMLGNDRQNVFRARLGTAETLIAREQYDDAFSLATELIDDARENERQRDESAALRLFAAIFTAQDQHQVALDHLSHAYGIATDIEDSVVTASLHILLADAYLALNDTVSAAPHVSAAAVARPEDYDSLKVQARFASQSGNADEASKLMGLARTSAGEGWSDDDDLRLSQYRAAVEGSTD